MAAREPDYSRIVPQCLVIRREHARIALFELGDDWGHFVLRALLDNVEMIKGLRSPGSVHSCDQGGRHSVRIAGHGSLHRIGVLRE